LRLDFFWTLISKLLLSFTWSVIICILIVYLHYISIDNMKTWNDSVFHTSSQRIGFSLREQQFQLSYIIRNAQIVCLLSLILNFQNILRLHLFQGCLELNERFWFLRSKFGRQLCILSNLLKIESFRFMQTSPSIALFSLKADPIQQND